MKKIYYRLYLFIIFISLFACQGEELKFNSTFYKIYDTELSGAVKGLPTTDFGILVLEAEASTQMSVVGTPISVDVPHLTKFSKDGSPEWQFKSDDDAYFAPQEIREEATYFTLFTYSLYNTQGVKGFNYENFSNFAEVQIDKETGEEINRVIYTNNAQPFFNFKVANEKYLSFNQRQIGTLSQSFGITASNNWLLRGRPQLMEYSQQHFFFKQSINENTDLILAASQDLNSISTLCFSSLDAQYSEGNLITNVYPINNEEYIFVLFSTAGLQPSIYFTPAISLKSELESQVLKEPIFRNNLSLWIPSNLGPPLITQEYIGLKNRYGNSFREPLRARDILTKAYESGELYRTFDLDINDSESFIKKAKDRILIIRNSGNYEILLYEYFIAEKKYKLLRTLGRNIPYYIQDVSVNTNGDLFIVGNTQIAKDLNSLFVIKIPYEDIPN